MSLRPRPIGPVPEQTAQVAHAAFPKGNPYLTLRDHLGTIFQDEDFTTLFPTWGYPGLPPWRLALVTLMQFREHLADRQAAEAVRATRAQCRASGGIGEASASGQAGCVPGTASPAAAALGGIR
jgi:transposase